MAVSFYPTLPPSLPPSSSSSSHSLVHCSPVKYILRCHLLSVSCDRVLISRLTSSSLSPGLGGYRTHCPRWEPMLKGSIPCETNEFSWPVLQRASQKRNQTSWSFCTSWLTVQFVKIPLKRVLTSFKHSIRFKGSSQAAFVVLVCEPNHISPGSEERPNLLLSCSSTWFSGR